MGPHRNKRLPSSCEPCRGRKIRCNGTEVPCQTCVRRGRGSSCYYKKSEIDGPPLDPSRGQSDEMMALEARLARIESMLQKEEGTKSSARDNSSDVPLADAEPALFVTGKLIRSPSGHVWYMPQGLGSPAIEHALSGQTFQSSPTLHTSFPFQADPTIAHAGLVGLLPPADQCDRLYQLYMQVFSPLFHVLHEPSLAEDYRQFRQNPHAISLTTLALIFMIFSLASLALPDDDVILCERCDGSSTESKVQHTAAKYRSAAMQSLTADGFMWRHNLETVKTLVLMIYSFNHTNLPAYALLGTTLHIAVAIGCHIDPSMLGGMSDIESEERRRCWAALMMHYTTQNMCHGNFASPNLDSSTKLPADVDDEDLCERSVEKIQTRRFPSKMAYIMRKFTLYRLASSICKISLLASEVDYNCIAALDKEIEEEELIQTQTLLNIPDLPVYHRANFHLLAMYTNLLYVILHRPCTRPGAVSSESDRIQSLYRIMRATTRILTSYCTLCTEPTFKPYVWFTQGLGGFYALLAAAALMTAANDPGISRQSSKPAALFLLHTCLERFSELAHRSDICRRGQHLLKSALGVDIPPESNVASQAQKGKTSPAETLPSTTPVSIARPGSLTSPVDTTTAYQSLDTNGWDTQLGLLGLVAGTPSSEWLPPATTSWDQWLDMYGDST